MLEKSRNTDKACCQERFVVDNFVLRLTCSDILAAELLHGGTPTSFTDKIPYL